MKILGSKLFSHDSSIAVLDFDKKDLFAIATERVTRIKHDFSDISPILKEYKFKDIDYVVHSFLEDIESNTSGKYWMLLFENKLREIFKPIYIKDRSCIMNNRVKYISKYFLYRPLSILKLMFYYYKIRQEKTKHTSETKNRFKNLLIRVFESNGIRVCDILFKEHHLCHALSSYYLSEFAYNGKDVLVFTNDGNGDGFFSKVFIANGGKFDLLASSKSLQIKGNNVAINVVSIGGVYNNFTDILGFRFGSDEGKVEALAAYGKKDQSLYDKLIMLFDLKKNQMIANMEAANELFDRNFLESELSRIGKENMSATVQSWLEDVVVMYLKMLSYSYQNIDTICLSGGVVANVIMNLNIYERTKFKNIYISPAMADDGTAIGAAIAQAKILKLDLKWLKEKGVPYYGDEYTKAQVKAVVNNYSDDIKYEYFDEWYNDAAENIYANKVIAVFHGRMEFGPRALGNRSILANPLDKDVRLRLNTKVKKRPEFQPFCPSVLEEEREKLFESSFHHKYMATAFRMKEEYRDIIPSGIHVDGTARPQFVLKEDNLTYYKLIKKFKELSGYGIIIDTSFNLHGRTIVRTPKDAIVDFLDCNIDILYLEGYKITRRK